VPAEGLEHLALAPPGWQRERPPETDLLGHDRVDERVEGVEAQNAEHLRHVLPPGPDVSVGEVAGLEDVGRWRHGVGGEDRSHGVRCLWRCTK
jgi:hypothetical protein